MPITGKRLSRGKVFGTNVSFPPYRSSIEQSSYMGDLICDVDCFFRGLYLRNDLQTPSQRVPIRMSKLQLQVVLVIILSYILYCQ